MRGSSDKSAFSPTRAARVVSSPALTGGRRVLLKRLGLVAAGDPGAGTDRGPAVPSVDADKAP